MFYVCIYGGSRPHSTLQKWVKVATQHVAVGVINKTVQASIEYTLLKMDAYKTSDDGRFTLNGGNITYREDDIKQKAFSMH